MLESLRKQRQRLPSFAAGWVGLAVLSAACSAVLGIHDPIVDAGAGDATKHPGSDATTTSEASTTGDSAAQGDAGCSGVTVDTTNGFFVSAAGTDGTSCGPVESPCKTIQTGILNASTTAKAVLYVGPGVYVESPQLRAGLTVRGGFTQSGTTWTPICGGQAGSAVQVQAPAGSNVTVVADALGGAATLRDLTLTSATGGGLAPGESVYGILALGATTHLVLDDVTITLAGGARGADGDAGAQGAPGAGTCPSGDSAQGDAGAAGPGADGGTFGEAGYVPGAGAAGATGVTGHAGADGGPGKCVATGCALTCGTQCPTHFGGACGQAGRSGCGGHGGAGGAPGKGGGSSIAVFAWGADVKIVGSALQPGSGGAGGAGGPGGTGGPGAAGAPGDAGVCVTACPGDASCAATASTHLAGGDAGGRGGPGGPGGTGGGGAGGWTCGYLHAGDASVVVVDSSIVPAEAGAGGAPSGAPGLARPGCP